MERFDAATVFRGWDRMRPTSRDTNDPGPDGSGASGLLLENGTDFLLLENGDFLLLEG